jgi:hypothetical protein
VEGTHEQQQQQQRQKQVEMGKGRMMDGETEKVFTKVLMRISTMLLGQVHNRNLYPI